MKSEEEAPNAQRLLYLTPRRRRLTPNAGAKHPNAAPKALLLLLLVVALAWTGYRARGTAQEQAAYDSFPHTNKLIGETSPYLLEHAHNPVDWYPWGAEALEKARRENKPIFLSIGYSACHWCHVMERESFENEEIARVLNADFVAIKVDREQRPDLDAQYLLAVQMLTGSGGWPLSVFLLPDRKPFFGGTYFPPDEFKRLLQSVEDAYKKHPDELRAQADKVANAVAASASSPAGGPLPADLMAQAARGLSRRYDHAQGGFSPHPKFPEAPSLAFLLARYRATGDKTLLAMVTTTLDHMAAGGLYDQLGGGFHRYSTDALWRVPHFEKMLYDQAQLIPIYLDAYQITHTPRYKQVAVETLAFVAREMSVPDGGFASTLDADSGGEEGQFYLWTPAQVKAVLGDEAPLFDALFGVTPQGDLDGKSVLHLAAPLAATAQARRLSVAELTRRVEAMRIKMLAARSARPRPRTDDKALASWNGLMIAACAHAYQVLGDETYRQFAIQAAGFLDRKLTQNEELRHSFRMGRADVPGLLEDYAFSAYGLLELYAATHDRVWLDRAEAIATQMTARFGDAGAGGFYTTAAQGDLLARLKDPEDNAVPSGNGMAALVLARLATLTHKPAWRDRAAQTVAAFGALEMRVPEAFPTLLLARQALGDTPAAAAPPATVRLSAAPISAKAGHSVLVAIHVTIQSGWHINAHQASASYLIPTTLRLATTSAARLTDVQYPAGQSLRLGFASEPLSVYQGELTIKATVLLPHSTPSSHTSLRFVLSYQACNDRSCLPPTQAQIDVPLQPLP